MFLNAAYSSFQIREEGENFLIHSPPLAQQAEAVGLPRMPSAESLNITLQKLEVDVSETPYYRMKRHGRLVQVRESILGLPLPPAKDVKKLRLKVAKRIAQRIHSPLDAAAFVHLMMSRIGLDLFLSAYWLLRADQKRLDDPHIKTLFAMCYGAVMWTIGRNRDYVANYLVYLLSEAICIEDPDPDHKALRLLNRKIAFQEAKKFVRTYLIGLPAPEVHVVQATNVHKQMAHSRPTAMLNVFGCSPLMDLLLKREEPSDASAPAQLLSYTMPRLDIHLKPK